MSSRGRPLEVDLSTVVGSLRLRSAVLVASGTAGRSDELSAYLDLASLGAVVVKSLGPAPWPGNRPPRVAPVRAGMLNSIGLQGPGVEAWLEKDLPRLSATGATIVASIWGRTAEEFAAASAMLADAPASVAAVEVNISCPNLEDRRRMFAQSPSATAEAVAASAGCRRPRWAKLSPNVADVVEIADAALGAGADALVLVNTLAAMAIDVERRRPVLGAGSGGLSGAALLPVAVRAVWECRRAFPHAPIVGAGGVAGVEDALQLLMAGAQAVEIGTALFADPRAPARVSADLARWCRRHGVSRVASLVGAACGGTE